MVCHAFLISVKRDEVPRVRISPSPHSKKLLDIQRNTILQEIEKDERAEWKKKSEYQRRSLSETAMFRFETILGSTLYSRKFEKQKIEAKIKVKYLNKMIGLGNSTKINYHFAFHNS